MAGYYLMYRGWMDNPVFGSSRREPYCQRSAWVWLIEHAHYEPTQVRINGKLVELQRGQLSHSYRYLAAAWGWQHDRCRRLVALLSQCGMVATDVATGQLVITICNYDKYQASPHDHATAVASAVRQQRDRHATDIKEGKEEDSVSPSSDATASPEGEPGADAPDPVKELWDRGLAILGPKQRSLLGKLVKQFDKPAVLAAIIETEREQPVDPVAFLINCCERRRRSNGSQQHAYDALARAAIDYDDRQDGGGPVKAAH